MMTVDVCPEPLCPIRAAGPLLALSRLFALAVVVTSLTSAAHAQTTYVAVDLSTLPGMGSESRALGINNGGDVVGSTVFDGQWHAYLWTPTDGVRRLGAPEGSVSSWARAINDSRHVVGSWLDAAGVERAFIWTQHTGMIDLGVGGSLTGEAVAINKAGQVAGSHRLANGSLRAFRWSLGGGLVDLGTPEGQDSVATGINDEGVVTCYFTEPSGARSVEGQPTTTPCFSTGNELVPVPPTAAASQLPWTVRVVHDISGSGRILGEDESAVAFVWSPDTGRVDLPEGTVAAQINDRGEVVGFTSVDSGARAMLWRPVPTLAGGTSLSADRPSPQPSGTTITLVAKSAGGVEPTSYRFWMQTGSGHWTLLRDWQRHATHTWTPTTADTYKVWVHARGDGGTDVESEAGITFDVISPAADRITSEEQALHNFVVSAP